MNTKFLKLKLNIINKITQIEEVHIIEEIKQLLEFELNEGDFELNEIQEQRIAEGWEEYENGKILSEEEANQKIDQWLKER